ncbi:hypothetical protein [Tepidibacter hydrothermalis]|uniref:Uncharacterized protein n=1 Tax=Tepidibacter hydrothermalis TaxID=3036126 RepID=A0ABY8EAY7_9FIRM|nr:hypothetical protein [Tepidibacter hydrothermalis]WFD09961.1 hypothetical protein P4S50_16525 [Tepidibacter hydrothermalis]
MDHVINGMKSHYEVLLDWFVEEHKSGKYKKLSDNPYYDEIKALIDSMNILRKYLGWETIKLKDEVKFYMEG